MAKYQSKLNVSELVAIDVHTHANVSQRQAPDPCSIIMDEAMAKYFKSRKPKSKVLVLDANGDVTSKGALFKKAWADLYPGMIEYRPNSKAVDVDWRAKTVNSAQGWPGTTIASRWASAFPWRSTKAPRSPVSAV